MTRLIKHKLLSKVSPTLPSRPSRPAAAAHPAAIIPARIRDQLSNIVGPDSRGRFRADCFSCKKTGSLFFSWRDTRYDKDVLTAECRSCGLTIADGGFAGRLEVRRPKKERSARIEKPPRAMSLGEAMRAAARDRQKNKVNVRDDGAMSLAEAMRAAAPPAPYSCVEPDLDAIPRRLRRRAQWVVWRAIWNPAKKGKGGWDKVLFQVSGAHASSTDPSTWTTFERARAAYRDDAWAGVGFVLTKNDNLVGIDLDHVIENGAMDDWAIKLVSILKTYTELSPSGTGLRLFLTAHLPEASRHKCDGLGEHGTGVFEVYDRGRYLTITGKRLAGFKMFKGIPLSRIERRQRELDAVLKMFFPEPAKPVAAPRPRPAKLNITDKAVVAKASKSKDGDMFRALYFDGDCSNYNGNHSRADFALIHKLLFWTGGNAEQVERLFGASALGQRDKWTGRPDYRERTIANALADMTDFYDPNYRSRRTVVRP